MNKEEFKLSIQGKTVLVDFGASWCGPCRSMRPVIEGLAEKYKGRADVLKLDIDREKELAIDYSIQSVPTFILFRDGMEIKRFVGMQSGSALEKSVDMALVTKQ